VSGPTGGSWCPECGPDVKVDQDALCAGCGATCTGSGAELALKLRTRAERAEALNARLAELLRRAKPSVEFAALLGLSDEIAAALAEVKR